MLKIPLILKPLRVQRGEDGTGARLIGLEEPPRLNPYLIELLDRRFDIDLSPIDVDLERVVRADGLGQVLKRIRTRLARTSSLEVIEEAVVSSFDLSSFDLWRDLEGVSAMAADNPLLHSLMAHAETSARDPTPPDDAERDRSAPPFPPPLPADSSQAHAIAATYAGENFVLAASPGTGRTRTIANIIATTIGAGRTVLFVGRPEALRVAYDRLERADLSSSCLSLESDHTVRESLARRLERMRRRAADTNPITTPLQAGKLNELGSRLDLIHDLLHRCHRSGLTVYEAIARLAGMPEVSGPRLSIVPPEELDAEGIARQREAAQRLARSLDRMGDSVASGFPAISWPEWTPEWESALMSRALSTAAGIWARAAA